MLGLSELKQRDLVRRKPDGDPKPVFKVDGNIIHYGVAGLGHYKNMEVKTAKGWVGP